MEVKSWLIIVEKGDNMGKNWEFRHVGVVVRDMDKALEYYQSLGIATFEPEVTVEAKPHADWMSYGKPADPNIKLKIKIWEQLIKDFPDLKPKIKTLMKLFGHEL